MAEIIVEHRVYRITGMTPMLGTQPADPAIRQTYITSRAPSTDIINEENENDYDLSDKGMTVFTRWHNNRNEKYRDCLCMQGYQILGMIKEALESLQTQTGIAQPRSKVDKYLFCEPRMIPIIRDGKPIFDEDEVCERPLRATTMKGPRVSLASSEQVNDPWELTFELTLLPNRGTPKSKPLTWDDVETALNYGAYRGLSQWRNAGWGKYVWKEITDEREEAV